MYTNWIFLLLAVISIIVGGYVLVALARHGWRKFAGPSLLGLVLVSMCVVSVLAMGLPRPLWTFIADTSTYHLVGFTYVEGKAIYVWLAPESGADPVVVQFPWSEKKADQLNEAMIQLKQDQLEGDMSPGDLARGTSGSFVFPKAFAHTNRVKVGG